MTFLNQMDFEPCREGRREPETEREVREAGKQIEKRTKSAIKRCVWGRKKNRLEVIEKWADKKLCGGERKWEWLGGKGSREWGMESAYPYEAGRNRGLVCSLYPLAPSVSGLDDSSWSCDLIMWPRKLLKKKTGFFCFASWPKNRDTKSTNTTINEILIKSVDEYSQIL